MPATAGAPVIIAIVAIALITLISFIAKVHDEYLAQREFQFSQFKPGSEEYQRLQIQIDPKTLSFIGKLIFFTFRGVLSGAKNAFAALESIKGMFHHAIISLVLTIIKIGSALGYSVYLGFKSMEMEYDKRNISDKFTLFSATPSSPECAAPIQYFRNDYT